MSSKSFQNVNTLNNFGPSDPFEQIPQYPQAVKGQATRIKAGPGSIQTKTDGSSSSYSTQKNPVDMTQLWTNANNTGTDLTYNWVANKAIQTTIGSDARAQIAGVFSETSTYGPNNGEAISIVGMTKALADRNPSGTGSGGDLWGAWFLANNNGWNANLIGIEVNCNNQYANWMEASDPVNNDPSSISFGIQIFPDWSNYHSTRAISIRPQENENGRHGYSTGILVTGYIDHGLFIDSKEQWRDPQVPPATPSVPAQPVGITFGSVASRKIAFWSGTSTAWAINVESDFLLFRQDESNWFLGMNKTTKNVHLVNNNFRFDTAGRLNLGGAGSGFVVGNLTGEGLTISTAPTAQHPFAMTKTSAALSTAPGPNVAVLRWQSGTNAGTLKLVAFAGTSTTGVTVVDNVGTGNS